MTLVGAMKRTSGTQTGLSNLQENERLSMSLIGDVIQSTGYWPNPSAVTSTLAFVAATSTTPVYTFTAGQTITGTDSATSPFDTISVRYNSGGSTDNVINCTGSGSAAVATYINTFSLIADPNDPVAGHMILQCVLTLNGVVKPAVQLANGVTNLQILYGVQSNGGVNGNSIDAYLTAPAVTAGGWWGRVISVKVTLTFFNPLAGQPGQPSSLNTIDFTRIINVMNKAGVAT